MYIPSDILKPVSLTNDVTCLCEKVAIFTISLMWGYIMYNLIMLDV
jgi:hypothetical protein